MSMMYSWGGVDSHPSKNYVCGYCGNQLASNQGYPGRVGTTNTIAYIYICHFCSRPTFFDAEFGDKQYPGEIYGKTVETLPDDIKSLYEEARLCVGSNCFNASVMCCRKLLMHIAVSLGAKEGLKFVEYVKFLVEKNYVPPGAKEWIDHIRDIGNVANHEIVKIEAQKAKELVSFCEMLLKIIYEYPNRVKNPIIENEESMESGNTETEVFKEV